ncbi:hypothetical protein G7Y89_g2436 [Cudoniella acicularis]|uniref:Uncharacterized protein n=1 Tax=Cudoniella acicularis TaxID=354080 RepID=A0A8H4W641_9HELO|nr:hypothetical protein G7Y89_g2436 [Cudoniella acicularis]
MTNRNPSPSKNKSTATRPPIPSRSSSYHAETQTEEQIDDAVQHKMCFSCYELELQIKELLDKIEETLAQLIANSTDRQRASDSHPRETPTYENSHTVPTLQHNPEILSHESSRNTFRSAKFSDPPKLSDGVKPRFEPWETGINLKFSFNTDHSEDEFSRTAYIYSLTEGNV